MEKILFGVVFLFLISGCTSGPIQANELELTQKLKDYKSGDQSVLYIYIADTTDLANAKKAIFFPHVDKFSRLEITDSFLNFSKLMRVNATTTGQNGEAVVTEREVYRTSSNSTYVWLEFGGKTLNLTTVPKRYVKGEFVLASFSAVIQMERGRPAGITWDDGCTECQRDLDTQDPDQCIDNSCGVTIFECLVCEACINSTYQTCNIKLYLGWIGTDIDGRPLTSAGSLPSNFAKFSLVPIFRSAAGTIVDRISNMGNTSDAYDPRFDPNVNKPQITIG